MEQESETVPQQEDHGICLSCNKRKEKIVKHSTVDHEEEQSFFEKERGILTNPLTSKLQNFRQIFEGPKNSNSSTECLEKKGQCSSILQRMHSLSLLKSKEKISHTVNEEVELCQCDANLDTRFRTWPERGRDKMKSPKKVVPEVEKEPNNISLPINVVLAQLPLAYDPVTKQLRLLQPKSEVIEEEPPIYKKEMGHKRQPSLLSTISSTGSEVHLPLMPLHSNPHSHTSLSSLSNYSSSTEQTNSLERSCQPPRFGLASFWQRAFTRKSEESSSASWKLFSKSNFFQKGSRSDRGSCSSLGSGNSPTSTPRSIGSTGLILHSRPSFLPAKCPEEEMHHQLLHQKLLEESQRREQLKLQEAERRMEEMSKLEEQVAAAAKIWSLEILPQWEISRKQKRTRDLWWQGLPPSVRGQVWKLSIGNDLNVTPELFAMFLERARDSSDNSGRVGLESSVELIKLDLTRTFPHLGIFQVGGPYHRALDDLLSAYACFRPDIGYVQGMSFLAATLLLNLDLVDAFVIFANLLNRPLLHAFFRLDHIKMAEYYAAFESLLKSHLPKVHSHFQSLNLSPDLYLQEWIYTLYSRSLPLDLASRVWDVYCRDGDDVIFRIAVGILKLFESTLLDMDFIHAAQLLTNLPSEEIDGIKLFKGVEVLVTCQEKSRFTHMLTQHFKGKTQHT